MKHNIEVMHRCIYPWRLSRPLLKGPFFELVAGETLYSEPARPKPNDTNTIRAQILRQHEAEADREFENTLKKLVV
jgi:hypothetical protein